MSIKYATPEQIRTIKKLHYETGNIRAAYRPYKRMTYVNAIREIDMLNKKLASTGKKNKKVDPLGRYNKKQLRELAILGETYMKDQLSTDSTGQQHMNIKENNKPKVIRRRKCSIE